MDTKEMAIVILAGGSSSRMGENKLLLPLGEGTIISTLIEGLSGMFAESVMVTDHPEFYSNLNVLVTGDLIKCPMRNSLVGIYSGLTFSRYAYNMVVAGDMPFIVPALVRYLCRLSTGYDVTIPGHSKYFQPLCAVYHKRCLPHIESYLNTGRYKVLNFLRHVNVRNVDVNELKSFDTELLSFFNINTPADYSLAKDIYAKKAGKEGTL